MLLTGCLLLLLMTGLAGNAGPQEPEPFQISVNVDLVVLNAVVRGQNGQFAADLQERDFTVYEDGVRQKIKLFRHEDVPVTVGLVVDHSGSMKSKLADVVAAARTFVRSSRPDDQMFVVNFNDNVMLSAAGTTVGANRADAVAGAIANTAAIGMTALYDAVAAAFIRLDTYKLEKKVLIVISDGGDNASKQRLAEVLKTAEQSKVLVYAIGIFDEGDPDKNPGVLSRLARATGGEAFFPRERTDVVAICEDIARDIRNQYTIGYVSSSGARTDAWRSLRLTAGGPGRGKFRVRTRAGYVPEGKRGNKPQ